MGNYGISVIDGDMKYIDPSGAVIDVAEAGSGVMCVNFTGDDSGDEAVYSADKTFDEVAAAIDAGKMIIGKYSGDGTDTFFYQLEKYDEDAFVTFLGLSIGSDSFFEQFRLTIEVDNTVTGTYVGYDLSSLIVED